MNNSASETAQKRQELLLRVREFLDNRFLEKMGLAGRSFDLAIPKFGLSSLIYLVDVEGEVSFCLRIALDRQQIRSLKKQRWASSFWIRRDLPTPAVLLADLSQRTYRRFGFHALAEERIRGENIVDCGSDSGAFEALGGGLARVHQVRRPLYHGNLFRPKLGSYAYHFKRRNIQKINELVDQCSLPQEVQKSAIHWFRTFSRDFLVNWQHSLIHRRCTESDVMVDTTGAAWIIEPHRSGFGCFATDLIRAEERVCLRDQAKIERLHRGYFEKSPKAFREAYSRLAPLYRAEFCLAAAHRLATGKKLPFGLSDWHAYFERFCSIIGY